MDKRYENSKAGVLAMLRECSEIPGELIDEARVRPDPSVESVWLVKLPSAVEGYDEVLCELAGARDAAGRVCEWNDFELCETRERW